MQNSEWPDAEKLKELRQAGIFPLSKLSVHALTTAMVLFLTFLFIPEFKQLASLIVKTMSQPITNFDAVQDAYSEIFVKIKIILLTYLGVYLLACVILILFQSKFYFSLVNFAFNLA